MSTSSYVNLVDLNLHFPFFIDNEMKKKLCFTETLLVSYSHNKIIKPQEKVIKSRTSEDAESSVGEEETDIQGEVSDISIKKDPDSQYKNFHFFFFNKELDTHRPMTERDSIVMVNNLPEINPFIKDTCCLCSDNIKIECDCKRIPVLTESGRDLETILEMSESLGQEEYQHIDVTPAPLESIVQYKDNVEHKMLSPACSLTEDVRYGACIRYSICFPNRSICPRDIKDDECEEESSTPKKLSPILEQQSSEFTNESEANAHDDYLNSFEESEDNLLEDLTTTGGITISVETIGIDKDKFLVYSSGKFHKDGGDAGNDIIAIIDINLHTIEENRTQYLRKDGHLSEDYNYVAICAEGYFCKTSKLIEEMSTSSSLYFNYGDAKTFLLEGANIVLLRYLAITKYNGWIELTCLSIDGEICDNIYQCRVKEKVLVNDKEMTVFSAIRRIIDKDGFVKTGTILMTLTGRLIREEWKDSKFIIHLNPLSAVDPVTNEISRQIPLRNCWEEDLEIFSRFLQLKERRTMENEFFLSENSELSNLMEDYLQVIMLLKPRDVISFTQNYFARFSKNIDLPHNPYFDKEGNRVRYSYFC